MSGESPDQQALRGAIEYFNANLGAFFAGREIEIPAFWSPDIEVKNFEPSPFPGTYHGHEGLLQWTREIFEQFSEASLESLEMVEQDDLIATRLRITAKGISSGIEGSFDWGCVFEIRDGRCVRATSYPTYDEAVEIVQAGQP
jgi:ketosteroid isomerase-like protein